MNLPRLPSKKIIIGVVVTILIVEAAVAGWWVLSKKSNQITGLNNQSLQSNDLSTSSDIQSSSAQLLLNTLKSTVVRGEQFSLDIVLSTNAPVAGFDTIISYDPTLLRVISLGNTPVKTGTAFSDYPVNLLDQANGQIQLSGISSTDEGIATGGILGTISFEALAPGIASIDLEFEKGSTIDSNVASVDQSYDILESVQGLKITIQP